MLSSCPDCGASVGRNAIKCRCGWSATGAVPVFQKKIDCCVMGCPNPARASVWTKTGWANVCARVHPSEVGPFHYETIEQVPRVTNNPYLDEIRSAYKKSAAYARIHGPIQGAAKQREPGSDDDLPLGIPTDALERELAERMNP